MDLMINVFILLAGFIALIKGADFFVDGSSAMAKKIRVPGVIIGLTIVAMGTSAPELAVSTLAALKGANEIALSNVVGSNIFNLLCVLGICAIIHPIPVEKAILKRDFPLSIGITIVTFCVIALQHLEAGYKQLHMSDNVGEIGRLFSIILLVLFVGYITILIVSARKNKQEDDVKSQPLWKCFLLIILGLVGIIVGGQLVVNSARTIASTFGMSETLIGLTIVAVGTSLPELVTSIVASRKGENGLAVGNVIGSNIFNLLLIMGTSGIINPIVVNYASLIDLGLLLMISIVTLVFAMTRKTINRLEGLILVLIYIADIAFAIVR